MCGSRKKGGGRQTDRELADSDLIKNAKLLENHHNRAQSVLPNVEKRENLIWCSTHRYIMKKPRFPILTVVIASIPGSAKTVGL